MIRHWNFQPSSTSGVRVRDWEIGILKKTNFKTTRFKELLGQVEHFGPESFTPGAGGTQGDGWQLNPTPMPFVDLLIWLFSCILYNNPIDICSVFCIL